MGPPCRELQQAVCRARTKLQNLERELVDKDAALEEQEELTGTLQSHNAQLKSTLLDLYRGNAQVNEELRERLSPRAKSSPSKAEQQVASHRQFTRELAALAPPPRLAASRMDPGTEETGRSSGDEEGSLGAASGAASDPLEKRPNASSSSSEEEDEEHVEEEEEDGSISSPSSGTNKSRLLSPAPATSSIPPRPLPRTSLQVKLTPSEPDSSPRPPSTSTTPPPPSSAGSSSPGDDPNAPSGGTSRCNGFPSRRNRRAGAVSSVLPTAPGKVPLRNSRSLPGGAAAALLSPSVASRSSVLSGAGPLADPAGHHKHIPLLLAELEAAWELNKQLQERLGRAERELQTMAVDAELREEAEEARVAERAAALVQEVYAAQRERDAAVLARMRLAQQERDDALLRARQMEEERLRSEPRELTDSDVALEELLARIGSADSGPAIEQDGAIIVRRIARARERSRRITAEEMRAVLAERDGAIARFAKLEEELRRLREQNASLANNKRNASCEGVADRAMKAQLAATQQERDIALSRCEKLEEEIQTLRVYYSLHKSLSQEAGGLGERRGNNSHDNSHDGNHVNREGGSAGSRSPDGAKGLAVGSARLGVDWGQGRSPDGRLQEAESERDALRAQLQSAQRDRAVADDKAERLERLVGVLRKKLAHQT